MFPELWTQITVTFFCRDLFSVRLLILLFFRAFAFFSSQRGFLSNCPLLYTSGRSFPNTQELGLSPETSISLIDSRHLLRKGYQVPAENLVSGSLGWHSLLVLGV